MNNDHFAIKHCPMQEIVKGRNDVTLTFLDENCKHEWCKIVTMYASVLCTWTYLFSLDTRTWYFDDTYAPFMITYKHDQELSRIY